MIVQSQSHPWSSTCLFSKALLYVEKMEKLQYDDPDFALCSTLSLEFLARATLSHTSPTLLADSHSWRNIQYALGLENTLKSFSPSSIGIKDVFARIAEMHPEFTQEILGYCSQHIGRRNAELHTGELAFYGLKNSEWLAKYYMSCHVLLKIINKGLGDLFSMPDAVNESINALTDKASKSVQQDINAYKKVWEDKTDEEKNNAKNQATLWATRHNGHRVECPSCNSPAILQGTPSSIVKVEIKSDQDEVVQKQSMLPATFECVACGLKIHGFSKLSSCGLGEPYTRTSTSTIAEHFNLFTEDDIDEARKEGEASVQDGYEEDFNEL
ncbi:hypothetical protein [Serratia quinivorans]|uniref:hypothetical protein n=1 Tax=Serratia quinivorans TaxID=137545 RepID=UPI00217947C8|nr:hypothetical protein [Serratia quinivorans]CAI1544186.1 Uncharacterised protein [Serratia quinivorans]